MIKYEALAKNTKIFFGNSIPTMFTDNFLAFSKSQNQDQKNN